MCVYIIYLYNRHTIVHIHYIITYNIHVHKTHPPLHIIIQSWTSVEPSLQRINGEVKSVIEISKIVKYMQAMQ